MTTKTLMDRLVTDKVKLAALIVSIGVAGKKLDNQIQIAGASALFHLKEHGDVGFVNRLYTTVAKGTRKAALTSWFLAYGSLVANTEGNKSEKPFNYTKDKPTDVEKAMADPWFDHKPDAEPDEVFDLQKAIMAVIKKAQGKTLVHGELITGLQALLTEGDDGVNDEGERQTEPATQQG